MDQYDIIIIGGGSAGVSAARRASEGEGKVALIEPERLGGIGYHQGPEPYLAALNQLAHEEGKLDWETLKTRAHVISSETENNIKKDLEETEVDVLQGKANILSPSSVLVSGEEDRTLKTGNIILACGSANVSPVTMPLDDAQILASDRIPLIEKCPESILLVGATRMGMSWAWLFASLGVKVFLCDEQPRLWQGQDPELIDNLEKVMKSRKVKLLMGRKIISLLKEDNSLTLSLEGGIQFSAQVMAFCQGRKAAVEGLGVDTLDLETSPEGSVFADDAMLSSVPGLYAAGSVTGHERHSELSEEEGRIAGANACGKKLSLKRERVPEVFSGHPPLGSVGCFYEDAHHHGFRGVEGRAEWKLSASDEDPLGWIKVVADRDSKKVVGGQVFGYSAAFVLSIINLGIRKGLSPRDLAQISGGEDSPLKALQEASRKCFRKLSDKR